MTLNRTAPVLAVAAAFLAGCATHTTSAPEPVMSADRQKALSPDNVLADLKAGNKRFVAGKPHHIDELARIDATATGQHPKAVILGCIDSRVPPELIFDQGIGDLFVGRVAGNFENEDLLGSMEFATKVAGSKLVVVLGHSACGAVKGAIDDVRMGNLTPMLAQIKPAVNAASPAGGPATSKNAAYVQRVVEENVRQTVRDIRNGSSILADLEQSGDIRIVGAVYNIADGRVQWLDN